MDNEKIMKGQACLSCPNTDKCRDVWSEENRGPLSSGGLVICSALAFLLPLATGIIAGAVGRANQFSEGMVVLLTVLGLTVGVVFAAFLVHVLKSHYSRTNVACPGQASKPASGVECEYPEV